MIVNANGITFFNLLHIVLLKLENAARYSINSESADYLCTPILVLYFSMIHNLLVTRLRNAIEPMLRRSSQLFSLRSAFIVLFVVAFVFHVPAAKAQRIIPAAERMDQYLPLLQGKRVALLINQTSRVGNS